MTQGERSSAELEAAIKNVEMTLNALKEELEQARLRENPLARLKAEKKKELAEVQKRIAILNEEIASLNGEDRQFTEIPSRS